MISSVNRAGILLGVLYVVGVTTILLSEWSLLVANPVPWGFLAMPIGGLLMGAPVAAAYSHADRQSRRFILIGIGGMLAVLTILIWQEGWNQQMVAIGFVLLAVPMGGLLRNSLRLLSRTALPC